MNGLRRWARGFAAVGVIAGFVLEIWPAFAANRLWAFTSGICFAILIVVPSTKGVKDNGRSPGSIPTKPRGLD